MDPNLFRDLMRNESANVMSEMYSYTEVTRDRVDDILVLFKNFSKCSPKLALFRQVLERLQFLGETVDNLRAFEAMFEIFIKPFQGFESEYKCVQFFQRSGSYVPPQEITIKVDPSYVSKDIPRASIPKEVSYIYIPLRHVLKQIFELPGMLSSVLDYMKQLEQEDVTSNIIQAEAWQSRKETFGDEIHLSGTLYTDDFENNNGMGSHKGKGKVGAECISLPCLPPSAYSKIENIFPISLYKSQDEKFVPLRKFFEKTVEELKFLEKEGIELELETGKVKVHFSLAAVVGDNLAINSMLGFSKGFKAKYPCRFCITSSKELHTKFNESSCELRTPENHTQHLIQNDPKETGVSGLSVLNDLGTPVFDIMTVDFFHDIAEGCWEYDSGSVLHQFIEKDGFFTLKELNERLLNFDYGKDEGRNPPIEITAKQIKKKRIKMSGSESSCSLKNIGVIIGDLIPKENEHWRLVMLLKEIFDIVTAPYFSEHIPDYLASLVEEYLTLREKLFPKDLKPKHHLLVHYARMMKRFGALSMLGTLRGESKNREYKISSHPSYCRKNICKSIAIKAQLRISHRIRCNATFSDVPYTAKHHSDIKVQDLPNIVHYNSLLPLKLTDKVRILTSIEFKSDTIDTNVLMIPQPESYSLFYVRQLFEDSKGTLYVIVNEITHLTYYDEHFQAYVLHESYINYKQCWRCFNLQTLNSCFVSRIVINNDKYFIPKRWI